MKQESIYKPPEKIQIRKIKLNNNLLLFSNQVSNKLDLISSNQRFKKKQNFSNMTQRKRIKIKDEIKNKLNKGMQSVMSYRSSLNIYLPNIPKDKSKTYRIINKNSKREVSINSVSLNLEKNNSQKTIKIKGNMKEKFLQRYKIYRRLIKKELLDPNYSINCSKNFFNNNNKKNIFSSNTNNCSNNINTNNKNSLKDLNKLYTTIRKIKIFNPDKENINFYTIHMK
jgi:hypothetical protein